jgi:hypothetical protein
MVFMDSSQRSARPAFWRRALFSLSLFCVLYLGAVRPAQVALVQRYIGPEISALAENYDNIKVRIGRDEIWLVPSEFASVRFDLPFGGFFLLPLTLFIAARDRRFMWPMVAYHGSLLLLFPLFGYFILQGSYTAMVITILHEKAYKAAFIILGILTLRESSKRLAQ